MSSIQHEDLMVVISAIAAVLCRMAGLEFFMWVFAARGFLAAVSYSIKVVRGGR